MFQYNLDTSCKELHRQYENIRKKCNEKYHDEVDLGYMILSDPLFISTYKNGSKEAWKYLSKSMEFPPNIMINNYVAKSKKEIVLIKPHFKRPKQQKIKCFLCDETLADSMCSKVKYMEIKCNCVRMYTHNNCGDDFIMKNSSCEMCKEYYGVNQHCSALRSTLKF